MRRKLTQLFALCALTVSTLSPLVVHSQEEAQQDLRYENWYQVELIIFDRRYQSSAYNAETWPNNIELFYPAKVDFLFTEEEWYSQTCVHNDADATDGVSREYRNKRNCNPALIHEAGINNGVNTPASTRQTEVPNESGSKLSINAELPAGPASQLPKMEIPRIKLPKNDRHLNTKARRIASRPGFKILFHEAWRQDFNADSQDQHIVLTGGNAVENHFELEGSIKLSLSRYLHLETNLWRVQFQPNYGQEIPYWPPLPPIPAPSFETLSLSNDDTVVIDDMSATQRHDSTLSTSSLPSSDILLSNDAHTNRVSPQGHNQRSDAQGSFNLSGSTLSGSRLSGSHPSEQTDSGFSFANEFGFSTEDNRNKANLVSEIITLKQKRRMRSNELHYIDHPRLGILIKITPYEVLLPNNKLEAVQKPALDLSQVTNTAP